ncbi:MAG: Maf family protein, partial [Ignavibacteriaceae bacterium]
MIKFSSPVYLASKSPRRKKLLNQLNIKFKVIDVHINEESINGESPAGMVKRLSNEKLAKAREKVNDGVIITADTIVVINNEILGKPKDKNDAEKILKKLSGRTHTVYTGYSVFNCRNNKIITDYEKTSVTFRKLLQDEIKNYIASGTPMDKAGAYGIQDDFGAVFIKKINGDYYNVVGLPLSSL